MEYKNRGYVRFDEIKAQRVARLGWFENFHLDLHNPREFKDYLMRKLIDMGQNINFDVFKKRFT